jgi:hypothetical protein
MAASIVSGTSLFLRAAEEEKEVKIKFSDAPEAVQNTLKEQAKGAKIDSVDKETTKDGKTVYEADVMIDGTNYEVKVAEDGKLISKKVDKDEDEKKDGKDKKEGDKKI